MFAKRMETRGRTDVNYYTARRLGDMAESLGKLARAFDGEAGQESGLTRGDALSAMQSSAAMVCEDCARCSLRGEAEGEDGYYLYYLLRTFEQKGRLGDEDMPEGFRADCRRKEAYLAQLNKSLGRATLNLSWRNRFLESRDVVVSQFRELSVILEEFSHQIDQARDVTEEYEGEIKRLFRRCHMAVDSLLLFEYESGQREAYLTVRTTNGRCLTCREAAGILERAAGGGWSPARDSRTIITRQYATVRFLENGGYRLICGLAGVPRQGERYSGDNYTICENPENQVVMGICDGMGSGGQACRESRQVVELTGQLMEAGFSGRSALKLVNTVLLLAGQEQHPATLDVSCIDLHTAVLEVMKLGAVPTFVLGSEGVEVLATGQAPAGVFCGAEPVLLSHKLWDGDQVVMVTDGVLDALPGDEKEEALCEFLEAQEVMPPQELAERILEFALSFVPAARDDMTVLTAELWKRKE